MIHWSAAMAVLFILAASCTGSVGEESAGGGNTTCAGDDACDDGNVCTVDRCNDARCSHEALPDQLLDDDAPGDCSRDVCIGGALLSQADDGDTPEDDNVCTVDLCNDGLPANAPVAAGTPCGDVTVCDETGQCVGCAAPSDCPAPSGVCESATCERGVCGVGTAIDGTACASDGVFCNGQEICQGGSCISPGDPCDGPDGDADCSETCDEDADDCGEDDPNDSPCDDGLWCNGPDLCNPNGSCAKHDNPPCAGPDGDSNCNESCDEATDTCGHPDPNGSICSDGAFCNGTETCSGGVCGGSSGNPCPGPDGDTDCSETCNETSNNCSANDPDGTECNGIADTICCNQGICTTFSNCQ